ncbi:hypothetical protein [Streptacidiphilus albus]|uniref:hypothetical protein n=1 Tax=Streptacidiphilus albus TaxID=105425 RepID=UPI00054BD3CF|nr:hypothetical protein [Streptacidiphilus albus]
MSTAGANIFGRRAVGLWGAAIPALCFAVPLLRWALSSNRTDVLAAPLFPWFPAAAALGVALLGVVLLALVPLFRLRLPRGLRIALAIGCVLPSECSAIMLASEAFTGGGHLLLGMGLGLGVVCSGYVLVPHLAVPAKDLTY